jgi:hypothetical protein
VQIVLSMALASLACRALTLRNPLYAIVLCAAFPSFPSRLRGGLQPSERQQQAIKVVGKSLSLLVAAAVAILLFYHFLSHCHRLRMICEANQQAAVASKLPLWRPTWGIAETGSPNARVTCALHQSRRFTEASAEV